MGNLAVTYQNIADILSFETSNSELEQLLSHPSFDWDAIVSEGSRHLVLPALYCRLQSKKLLHVLPNDLKEYLEEITELNRERNSAILDQINIITEWFNKHNIEHAFLKGGALLALDCYDDIAERKCTTLPVRHTTTCGGSSPIRGCRGCGPDSGSGNAWSSLKK